MKNEFGIIAQQIIIKIRILLVQI